MSSPSQRERARRDDQRPFRQRAIKAEAELANAIKFIEEMADSAWCGLDKNCAREWLQATQTKSTKFYGKPTENPTGPLP